MDGVEIPSQAIGTERSKRGGGSHSNRRRLRSFDAGRKGRALLQEGALPNYPIAT